MPDFFSQLFVHNQCRAGNAGGQAQLLAVKVTIHAQANVVGVKVGEIKVVVLVIQERNRRWATKAGIVSGSICTMSAAVPDASWVASLAMVAVRRAILGFDLDVGVFFHELVE